MVAGDRHKVVEAEGVVDSEVAEVVTVVGFVEGGLQGAEAVTVVGFVDVELAVADLVGAEGDGKKLLFLYSI